MAQKEAQERCPNCDKILPKDARTCPDCYLNKEAPPIKNIKKKESAEKINYCPKCGKKFLKNSKYCQSCGKKIPVQDRSKFDISEFSRGLLYSLVWAFIFSVVGFGFMEEGKEGASVGDLAKLGGENMNRFISVFAVLVIIYFLGTIIKKRRKTIFFFLLSYLILGWIYVYSLNSSLTAPPATTEPTNCDEQQTLQSAKLATTTVNLFDRRNNFIGHGSGLILDTPDKNLILTNYHVIEDAPKIKVWIGWDNKGLTDASVYANYPDQDIALLKVDYKFTYTMPLINSGNLAPAETLYAIGWPNENGGEATITKGIFSRRLSEGGFDIIQTDASINPGNSGGPLVSKCGVVGINTAKLIWAETYVPAEGTGYALSSNFIKSIIYKK